MQESLFGEFGEHRRYCMACGSPWVGNALSCASCGRVGTPSAGSTHPIEAGDVDSYPLRGQWSVLERFPAGSVVAITGGPGSGKSSICAILEPTTWATTEQTPKQVGNFFRRLGIPVPEVFPTTNKASVKAALKGTEAGLFVLDSLTQVGTWTEQAAVLSMITEWARYAPGRYAIVILQVNGRGDAAGLMELPHMVDTNSHIDVDELSGYRTWSADKHRNGPLFSLMFSVGAKGIGTIDGLAQAASYSVEGAPGGYRLHPWPMRGAKWSEYLDAIKPPPGWASCAILAPSYPRGIYEPGDVDARRKFAEIQGLKWLSPETATEIGHVERTAPEKLGGTGRGRGGRPGSGTPRGARKGSDPR